MEGEDEDDTLVEGGGHILLFALFQGGLECSMGTNPAVPA